jgi:ferritin
MNNSIQALLSRQYYHELSNSVKYQRFCHMAYIAGLNGIAQFLNSQAKGEFLHSQIVADHIKDIHMVIEPGIIEIAPPNDVETKFDLLSTFSMILEIEKTTTAMLMEINATAQTVGAMLTSQWLNDPAGLLKEQIEEEYAIGLILKRIKNRMIGESIQGGIDYDIDMWIEQEFNK